MSDGRRRRRYGVTYVGKEDSRDTATRVEAFLVSLGRVIATSQAALVARDGVLVSLDAAIASLAE